MDLHELAMTALRATAIYAVLLIVVRALGKRTVGAATAFDFMIALILSEVVDEPIYGDVPFLQGLVAIVVVAAWHAVNSYLSYRSPRFDRLAGGEPTVLVRNGVIDRRALRRERLNEEELASLLRLQGVEHLPDVQQATLEPDGLLSVQRTERARPLTRADLDRVIGKAA